jgi:hypothetical protein
MLYLWLIIFSVKINISTSRSWWLTLWILKLKLAQYFKCANKGRVCVYVFIGMSIVRVYVSVFIPCFKKVGRERPDLVKFGDRRRASFTRSKLIKYSRHWQTVLPTSTLRSCSCRLRATSQWGCSVRGPYCRCLRAHGRVLAKSGSKPRPGEILIGYSSGYVKAWLGI